MKSTSARPTRDVGRAHEFSALREAGVTVSASLIIDSAFPIESLFRTAGNDYGDSPVSSGRVLASAETFAPDSAVDEALEELRGLLSSGRKVITGEAADDILSLWAAVEPALRHDEAHELRAAVIGRVTTGAPVTPQTATRGNTRRLGGE